MLFSSSAEEQSGVSMSLGFWLACGGRELFVPKRSKKTFSLGSGSIQAFNNNAMVVVVEEEEPGPPVLLLW